MVHDSMRNLKLDKRLARRRGWVEENELETALEGLPDVSEKVELVRVDEPAEASAEAPPPGSPAPPPEEPGL